MGALKKKEPEVLSTRSMVHLARGLGKDPGALTLLMLLNIPTTAIIKITYEIFKDGLYGDDFGLKQQKVVEKCLLDWREFTTNTKPKERIGSLEKALRNMGKNELADAFMERNTNNQELTPDIFTSS